MAEIKWEDIEAANKTLVALPITHKDKKGNYVTKDYFPVAQRIKAFRMCYPRGSIVTEMVSNANGVCVFRASVYDGELLLGTGHAQEKESDSYINQTSIVENTETSAIGRALGMVGFGVDADIASADEMVKAFNAQAALNGAQPQAQTAGEYKATARQPVQPAPQPRPQATAQPQSAEPKASPRQIEIIAERYTGANRTKLLQANGITLLEDLPRAKASEIITKLMNMGKSKQKASEETPPPNDDELPFDSFTPAGGAK